MLRKSVLIPAYLVSVYKLDYFVIKEVGKVVAPMQRVGTPEDNARVALFLASDLSGYITGDRIIVGGGTPLGYVSVVKAPPT